MIGGASKEAYHSINIVNGRVVGVHPEYLIICKVGVGGEVNGGLHLGSIIEVCLQAKARAPGVVAYRSVVQSLVELCV